MHGFVFTELRRYVEQGAGPGRWHQVCVEAGVERALHRETEHHATAELVALVEAGARITGTPVPALLESFGSFLAPVLLARYGHWLDDGWTALDVLEHAERRFHRGARESDPVAHPPRLAVTRTSAHEVQITYTSYRRLCHLALGIARGVLAHFGETGSVRETGCMRNGDEACLIVVDTAGARAVARAAETPNGAA